MVFLSGTIFIYKFRYNLLYFHEIIILHTNMEKQGIYIDNIGLVIYNKDSSTED